MSFEVIYIKILIYVKYIRFFIFFKNIKILHNPAIYCQLFKKWKFFILLPEVRKEMHLSGGLRIGEVEAAFRTGHGGHDPIGTGRLFQQEVQVASHVLLQLFSAFETSAAMIARQLVVIGRRGRRCLVACWTCRWNLSGRLLGNWWNFGWFFVIFFWVVFIRIFIKTIASLSFVFWN